MSNLRAPRLCAHRGCGELVRSGYCDKHKPAQAKTRLDGQRDYNMRRAESDRQYSTERWKKLSAMYRKRHPLCCECERNGLVRASELVDHIKPAKEHPELFFDWSNLRALCQRCHNAIGAKVRGLSR